MTMSRRCFLAHSGIVIPGAALFPTGALRPVSSALTMDRVPAGRGIHAPQSIPDRMDPWLEVNPHALRRNAAAVAEAAGGRPILAVVKNNGYGLGIEEVGPALDAAPEVAGLAVVKVDEAHRLRDAGVEKPILLMALAPEEDREELVRRGIRLAPFHDDESERLARLARRIQAEVPVHLYLDTGMGRLGMAYHRALPWIEALVRSPEVRVEGMFQAFTESRDFDPEQLSRFMEVADAAGLQGLRTGYLHAAASNAVTFFPQAALDMVRPGLMLFGAHVAGGRDSGVAALEPAFRLRARVVRVERLRPGDSVSYGRNFVADRPTWTATLPVGHADGYPREAVRGCRVLVAGSTYPVVGAVSASHTILDLGPAVSDGDAPVGVGEVATLVGPDHPDIHPNTVSEHTGRSIYDVYMHLSPELPKLPFT